MMENNVPARILGEWDRAAETFVLEQENSGFADSNKRVVRERFRDCRGLRVLDLGCGYGWYTEFFRRAGADVTGIDGSFEMLRLAEERYPRARFQYADLSRPLPFADGSFDLLFANQVLMDIEDVPLVFSEAVRMLIPGGVFWYGIVHPAFYGCRWQKDERGYRYAKTMERYLSSYRMTNDFWGTTHFHRPLSFYLNTAADAGLLLKRTEEPFSYDPREKNPDLPLFFFAEYEKPRG